MPRPVTRLMDVSRLRWFPWVVVGLAWNLAGYLGPTARADDPTSTIDDRVRQAFEAASALDAEAQQAHSVPESRAKWLAAAHRLDELVADQEAIPAAPSLRFQAAVYLWARARASLDRVDLLDATDPERIEVAHDLDDVVDRLRRIATTPAGGEGDPLAQNIRFRLAQTLADRARLDPELDPARTRTEKEAQALLDRSLNAPRLRSYARLLHAELTNRLGEFGAAQVEIEELAKLKEPPPIVPLTEARITALAGRGQYVEARKVADGSAFSPERKALWKLRIALAKYKSAAVGRDRVAVEAEVFQAALALGGANNPDSVRGLMEVARGIDQPTSSSPSAWWNLLADGQLALRNPDHAAQLAERGADQATPDEAPPLRFKVGAYWFQAGRYVEADTALTRVVDDPTAPGSLRARAGMLRALALGRALADRLPGASQVGYRAALENQVRDFGADPVSGEARWLLGVIRLAAGRRDEAITLWSGIAHGQNRWLEAREVAADQLIEAVEDQWINRDEQATRPKLNAARTQTRAALDQAVEGEESFGLGFRLARLESIPGAGDPAEAVAIYDRLLRGPANPDQHQRARLGRMVALAEQNRFADAETIARNEAKGADLALILPAVRRLDEWATITSGDLIRKRTGSLIRILLDPWTDPVDRPSTEDRDEITLRHARALLFTGDTQAGKRAIVRWGGPSGKVDAPGFLRDLGDTYFRLEAYSLAADAERLRVKKLVAGSPGWFDSRYLLSLALYRSDRAKDARKIIEATAILHPDLGGGETRGKFERLSQKIKTD